MIAVLIPARVSLCWNYQGRGTKWSLGVNNIAFHFINFICFAPHLHLTTYISSFLPMFSCKAFCCGSQMSVAERIFLPGNSEQQQKAARGMGRVLQSQSSSCRCTVGSCLQNPEKLSSGPGRYWIKDVISEFFFFFNTFFFNEWEKKDISGLVFLKATSRQKYLQGWTKRFSIVRQLLLSVTPIREKISFSEGSENVWA